MFHSNRGLSSGLSPVVLFIITVSVGIELTLQASDRGWILDPYFRPLAYQYGGFWSGLLRSWSANYDLQPVVMFVSYAWLHDGLLHLTFNMITLAGLSLIVVARLGQLRFSVLYLISVIGGGVVFGVLSNPPQPMVGASGGLFGLVGAYMLWDAEDRRRRNRTLWPFWRLLAYLVLFNAVSWWWTGGRLAWETHLGGFIGGALLAYYWRDTYAEK